MFVEADFKLLGEVFAMARVQTVNAQPSNRQALENIMNFEAIFKGKLDAANKALGAEAGVVAPTATAESATTDEVGGEAED